MPFLRACVGTDLGEHPDAYWTLARLEINPVDEVATVAYGAYHDATTYAAGGAAPIAGASRAYMVSGRQFRDLMASHLAPGGPNLAELAEALAAADPFFADAEQVPFPGTPGPGPDPDPESPPT